MRRFVKGLGLAVVGLVLLLAVAITALSEIYLTPDRLERSLKNLFGRNVEIDGPVEFSLWGDAWLTISQIHFKNPASSPFKHLATLDSISVGLRWWDLLGAIGNPHPHFLDVDAQGGKVHVDSRQDVVGDDGVWPSADDPFTGMLGWIDVLKATDLRVEIQADDERLEQIELEYLHVSFDTGKNGAVIIDAEDLGVTIEDIPLKGFLRLDAPIVTPASSPPATLSGKLSISEIDLDAVLGEPSSGKPGWAKDTALPVHDCLSWETEVALSIGELRAKSVRVTDLEFALASSAGAWKIQLKNGNFPAGHGHGEVSLQCGELPGRLMLQSGITSKGKRTFGQSGATVDVLGRMESNLHLRGEGRTWKELAEDLGGRFLVFLGPVQTGALKDRFYAQSLFHALTVSWGQSKKANVDCAVLDMAFEKGIGRIKQIVIGTPTLVIDGRGKVDLAGDEVDIVLVPRAKRPHLGSVDVPVRISGSIQEPKVGLDWVDVIPRLVIETGEALFAAFPSSQLSKEEREACRRSMEPLGPVREQSRH